jgi:hypothetical protein
MNPMTQFINYAAAFEEAYNSDDWSKLDPFFTDDAVYQPLAAFGGPIQGREALKAAFRQMVDAFDRRFASRAVEILEGPTVEGERLWFRWAGIYTLAGAPELRMVGEETVEFNGERIRRLEDRMSDEEARKAQAYMMAHGDKLKPVG